MSLEKFLTVQQPQLSSLSARTFEFKHFFINFSMKLFSAQIHLLKDIFDQLDYCNQLF